MKAVTCRRDAYLARIKLLLNLGVDVDRVLFRRERLVDVSADELAGRAVVQRLGARRVHVLQTHAVELCVRTEVNGISWDSHGNGNNG